MEKIFQNGTAKNAKFDGLVVVGDVNSTMAAALAAAKLGIPIAHVEAGLRSFDRSMPEEINRLVTDAVSEILFVSEPAGVENLRREGHPDEHIHLVGNLMIDTLRQHVARAREMPILHDLGLRPGGYMVLTLHRPSNVDDKNILAGIVDVLLDVARRTQLVFPVHPRTRSRLETFGLYRKLYV
jgi:UDP-N-acetylglucosamine 2-epimerase (non-hydrolysing)